METKVSLIDRYKPSEQVVAREIQGEFILVPIYSAGVDVEDALFGLNKSGQEIWHHFDGKKSLKDIAKELFNKYDSTVSVLENDVLGLVNELLKRKMIVKVKAIK